MELTAQLKENSGLDWVLTRLEPASPYGRALARTPRWYFPGDEEDLETELNRIEAAMERDCSAALHVLSEFHDVRGCLHRPADSPMDEVELFEIKHFLLCLDRLAEAAPPLDGLTIAPLPHLLDLLDPGGHRLPPFSVEGAFDTSLIPLREEKRQVELMLRRAPEQSRDALLTRRQELVREEDRLELAVRRRLTAALLADRDALLSAMDMVGRLDLVLAKARLAKKWGCVRPRLSHTLTISLTDMIHPGVAARLEKQGSSFTPVSICLDRGAAVVTGANMGGKSVCLRNVVLNLLLMHTGFYVFAADMTSPLFRAVHLICTDEQSVDRGLSSFGGEVAALDRILRQEGGSPFFLAMDEFARGTNPREGAALARALTQRLGLPDLNCVALLTTHYDGVSDVAGRHYQIAGLPQEADGSLDDLPRLMDYRLVPAPPGAPCPRDALKVCRLLGLDGDLLEIFAKNI